MPSIVDTFKHDGWESSYEEPHEESIIYFVYRHPNEAIIAFVVSSLETTHGDDNSTDLELNCSDNNKKVTSSTLTKQTDNIKTEQ